MGATRFLARGGVSLAVGVIAVLTVLFVLVQSAGAQTAGIISFGTSALKNEISANPTSLQFGPDGRLYVAQQDGTINAYTIKRNGPNDYAVTATETITLIKQIPNHNDNGALAASQHQGKRQVTGIVVTGTAAKPVIYVGSSDYRIGAGGNATDLNLDTNSGIISRLDWDGSKWVKTDLVRGLPRSEENHSINGLQLSSDGTTLYVAVGGNTNKGAPSNNFAFLPEYALSTAILSVDLTKIGNSTYDLPTLDDETRSGTTDANDPFGGNDGKNQAKLVADGPVQIYSPGYRNAYDLVITESGKMYTIDNGGNEGWGDVPENEGPAGVCTNKVMEPGTTDKDSLHYVVHQNYYGGHPNPTRGNKANTFNDTNPQSPVHAANAIECDYRDNTAEGGDKGELTTFGASTNGIAEYTASNFSGAMKGNLLAASFSGQIFRLVLNGSGTALTKKEALFSNFGSQPLDVTAQGDDDKFPGTVWAAVYGANAVQVFEPADYDGTGTQCTGADDPSLDEDGDGFKNADEIDNNTDPCSAASVPADWDGDKISNKNDPDDDNDGIPDASDEFAIDANNGKKTDLPVSYTWDNDAPRPGGLLSLGFTGLMTNGADNYESLFDPENMTAGGAAGVTTIDKVPAGDAKGSANTQKYGFQFGVNATSTSGVFTAHTRILAPFAGLTPQGNQSMGLFLGNGDQDNYVKLVTSSKGIEFAKETGGTYAGRTPASVTMPGPDYVDLYLTVDPAAGTVQPSYTVTANGNTGPRTNLGGTETVPAGWFGNATNGLAVGIISTSAGGSEFPATWDFIQVVKGQGGDPVSASELAAEPADVKFGNVLVGQEKSANVKLTNKGTQESLTIKSAEITPASTGTTAEGFSTSLGSQVTLKPGESITLAVKFKPQSAGSQAGTLAITHTGTNSPLGIPLSGFGAPGAPYRVNAGAGNLAGPPEWSADTLASPSPYVNAAETGNKTYINGAATIDTSDPSVPPGTPPALFKSERWDPPEGPEMSWKFPVEPGKYKVRLYFAEIYSGAYKEGARVFDVLVEGQTVLDNYDVYKEAGGGEKGIVETFEATSDDVLNIDFAHGPANNPAIKGIEILPVSTGPGSTAEAQLTISPFNTDIDASTYENGSFKITNNSTNGEKITSLKLDLSTAILPDVVFDPDGTGGDTVFKCFKADSGASTVGLVTDGSGSGDGSCKTPFSQPHEGGGYDVLEIKFNDFGPGETFTFSADLDPTSIKGTGSPGPGKSGSISGLELTGATATTSFDDGSTHVAEPYRKPATLHASQNVIKANPPAKPGVTVPGVTLQPTTLSAQHFAATVNKAEQTVRVSGPAGASVQLMIMEGGLFINNNPYEREPYEANSAVAVSEKSATIGTSGTVDIPVTLTRKEGTTAKDIGLNHIVAVVKDAAGRTGPNSDVAILKYDPNYKGSQKILNPQPSTVSFGQVEVGNEKSQQISLFNTGDAEVTVQSAETSGADADQFVATLGGPTKVAPGESITLPVKFAPTSAGSKAAKLTLGHDGQNSPLEVQLSGTGVEPAPSDTVAPDTRILSGPSRFVKSRTARLAFESTEANSRFQCRLDGGSYASCSVPKVYRNLSDGRHVFQVRAIDSAGNVDGTPAVRRWTVDNSGPTVNPLSPRPGAKLTTRRPTVKAIVRDEYTNLGGGAIKLYVDGKQVRFAYDKKTDRLVYRSKKLSLGKHTVKVVANDAAKNRTTRTWSFKVVKR